jgi:hypothetical protein
LRLESDEAGTFEQKGLRGDERAALAKFFRERIGDRFDVQKGEAIDYQDTRTGQLDFVTSVGRWAVSLQQVSFLTPWRASPSIQTLHVGSTCLCTSHCD